jgi:hypothetical protein
MESSPLRHKRMAQWLRTHLASLAFIFIALLVTSVLALSVRGLPGNPDAHALLSSEWHNGPFESSNDRGRYALAYSLLEDHEFQFSPPIAQFAAPDVARREDGQYVSLFAPGVSFLIMPGYLIGKWLGAAQMGVFATVGIIALMNTLLIYIIAKRLGAHPLAAGLGALSFLFATPAFTYGVSLSQHHFSVFGLLLSLYLLVRWNNWWSLSLIWFLCALSVVIDNPNLFLMFPIGAYALGRIIFLKRSEGGLQVNIRPLYILTFLTMIIPLTFFAWFNQNSNGSPSRISGSLQRILSPKDAPEVKTDMQVSSAVVSGGDHDLEEAGRRKSEVSILGFFTTRRLWTDFYVHFISPDRGILWFTPVVILGILGFIFLFRVHGSIAAVIVASTGANILIYSMWDDPWGGWSFGSRYLIPTYALLCIGLGIALAHWRKNIIFLVVFLALFTYSVRVNALGALGTSVIPPRSEVLALEKMTGLIEKYDFERSRDYLYEHGSKSFVYNIFARKSMTAPQYYTFVSSLIIIMGGILLLALWFVSRKEKV